MHDELPRWMNEISGDVLDASLEIHRALGPGLLESAYEICLEHELLLRGRTVERQVPLPVVYKDAKLDAGYRMDLLVNGAVVVELKSVDALAPIHEAQLLTYLRLSGRRLGLLINFNVVLLKQGVKRLIASAPSAPLR